MRATDLSSFSPDPSSCRPRLLPNQPNERFIDSVFLIPAILDQHLHAPMLKEREAYLNYLVGIGTRRERVRNIATMLLHVIRLFQFESGEGLSSAGNHAVGRR